MRALGEALKCHVHAIKYGFVNAIFITNNLIGLYSDHGSIEAAHKLFNEMSERNVYSWNTIMNAYIKSRNLSQARTLFDSCPCRDTVTYNSMISGYARSGRHENEAIELLIQMQCDDDAGRIDEFTLTTMLNMIAKLRIFDYGRQLHSFMVKSGNDLSSFALSSLIDMYSKCGNFLDCCWIFRDGSLMDLVVKNTMLAACFREGELEMAQNIFMIKPELNDNVSWNTMISGYLQNGHEMEAIESFKCMAEVGFQWNEHTFASLLVSSTLKSLAIGKEVHSLVLKEGMLSNPFISSGIVDIYCKCGNMRYAEIVHESFGMGNLFSTTSMIVGYSAEDDMIKARRLFDLSEEKNYVMWTAIITGYTKLQKCEDAFVLFRKFTAEEKTVPDLLILISLLGASAILASMVLGKQIHAYTIRTGVKMDEKASCALVDMYSKCGSIIYAQRVFERISRRDSVIYNVMIAGCAHHGYENEATNLFEEMMERGLQPDAVTFIALLSACRHRGLAGLRLLLCPLGSNIVVRTACCSVGIVLPVYSTFKAIEAKDQDEQQKWLLYWAAYGSFSVVELFTDKFLYWFPLYYHMKFAFLVWLQLPSVDGARKLYMNHLRPFLLRHQPRLDQLVGFLYGEMAKFISNHEAEIQFAKTLLFKILLSANDVVKEIIHPGQRRVNYAAIEAPPETGDTSESEDEE
ncbi:putative pentatricopeptide repeat-containing protein At3g18840 [Primulina eburnea]|uniref:putative pentatricopeptide repeat-containing protein At3g18840 n=1 Tax=Primulina eburnea TaxID=1245227 RepID=UPI003C6C5DBF